MDYDTVIGLEVHAQLLTNSKMYCSCDADYALAPPNTHVCPVCMGMPGVLPTINGKAIEYTVLSALALNCDIPEFTKFDRKNYPYPDLMKGYQISQYDAPIGVHGWINIDVNNSKKRINITRVHLEEDVAKLVHRTTSWGDSHSLVDINRAGVPLMEIVSEPDMSSPEEARQYLIQLRSMLRYLGVSTGNMEEGSFRCDANISIRSRSNNKAYPKIEVKNMNSFKAVYRALEYEEQRQRKVVDDGGMLSQETRGWIEEKGITVSQRSKEHAHDYRYFPEPDLPPLTPTPKFIEDVKACLPELPEAKRDRFIEQYKLSVYDASLLCTSKSLALYFEECVDLSSQLPAKKRAKSISNWLLGEFTRLINAQNIEIDQAQVSPQQLVDLLNLIEQGTISGPSAKEVFEEMFNTGKPADQIVSEKALTQISDTEELERIVNDIITNNPSAVSDFKAGKEKSVTFLVGQVMRATKGRANPSLANDLIRKELDKTQ
ncbi:MAG: Asp-tRNA(Asn)/Glu-tRNA(Gln) amidotransferase subunit GatB [Chloroflexota bacterium]|nr:Asp-tRNA(Asn)/Glu-tRNA(Gln) amidotransferase subunit GatB [Chloroflexota bacterium]